MVLSSLNWPNVIFEPKRESRNKDTPSSLMVKYSPFGFTRQQRFETKWEKQKKTLCQNHAGNLRHL